MVGQKMSEVYQPGKTRLFRCVLEGLGYEAAACSGVKFMTQDARNDFAG